MGFVRQLRGHSRMVFTPTTVVLLGVVVVVIATRARNAPTVLVEGEDGVQVALAGSVRIAVLQMSTLAGMVVAAIGAAALSTFVSTRQGEQFISGLEPCAIRRWLLRFLTVLAFLSAGALLATTATYGAGLVQASRLAGPVRPVMGEWQAVGGVLAHAALPMAAFAAIAILLSALLRGSPAVAAAAAAGGTQALLLLQHLVGTRGDIVVPTAWVARWLDLPARDFGVAYLWTTGSFDTGRAAAGAAVAVAALIVGILGWSAISRAARS